MNFEDKVLLVSVVIILFMVAAIFTAQYYNSQECHEYRTSVDRLGRELFVCLDGERE